MIGPVAGLPGRPAPAEGGKGPNVPAPGDQGFNNCQLPG